MPGLVERLLGFLDIGKDFVTAETIVQVKDLARKYPDIAEVCVGSISNISLEVSQASNVCMVASALCHSCLYITAAAVPVHRVAFSWDA